MSKSLCLDIKPNAYKLDLCVSQCSWCRITWAACKWKLFCSLSLSNCGSFYVRVKECRVPKIQTGPWVGSLEPLHCLSESSVFQLLVKALQVKGNTKVKNQNAFELIRPVWLDAVNNLYFNVALWYKTAWDMAKIVVLEDLKITQMIHREISILE